MDMDVDKKYLECTYKYHKGEFDGHASMKDVTGIKPNAMDTTGG